MKVRMRMEKMNEWVVINPVGNVEDGGKVSNDNNSNVSGLFSLEIVNGTPQYVRVLIEYVYVDPQKYLSCIYVCVIFVIKYRWTCSSLFLTAGIILMSEDEPKRLHNDVQNCKVNGLSPS